MFVFPWAAAADEKTQAIISKELKRTAKGISDFFITDFSLTVI